MEALLWTTFPHPSTGAFLSSFCSPPPFFTIPPFRLAPSPDNVDVLFSFARFARASSGLAPFSRASSLNLIAGVTSVPWAPKFAGAFPSLLPPPCTFLPDSGNTFVHDVPCPVEMSLSPLCRSGRLPHQVQLIPFVDPYSSNLFCGKYPVSLP